MAVEGEGGADDVAGGGDAFAFVERVGCRGRLSGGGSGAPSVFQGLDVGQVGPVGAPVEGCPEVVCEADDESGGESATPVGSGASEGLSGPLSAVGDGVPVL
ncbi:hypothetical protein GCM10010336_63290 [Streptomyces goshikiensis]|nr:hypothetical protein GCM10010336_63290 [Streptomyces goshikiensis]